jgi:hypothetical protein
MNYLSKQALSNATMANNIEAYSELFNLAKTPTSAAVL